MADDTKVFPTQSNRDPSKEHNQLHPRSQRSSGSELDEGFGEIGQSQVGEGLDKAIKFIDGDRRKK